MNENGRMDGSTIQTVSLLIVIACLVVAPVVLAYRGNNKGALISASACGLGAVLLFLPQIQSVEFWVLKAQMREKIAEASATTKQLQSLGVDLARVSVLGMLDQGGLGGPRVETLYAIKVKLRSQLEKLGVKWEEVQTALASLDERIGVAFAITIEEHALSDRTNPNWRRDYECLSRERGAASTEKLRTCLSAMGNTPDAAYQALNELEEFRRSGKIARLDRALAG